jgi:hypothetical protein
MYVYGSGSVQPAVLNTMPVYLLGSRVPETGGLANL